MTAGRAFLLGRPCVRLAALATGLALVTGCAQPGDPVREGPAAADPNIELRFSPTDLAGDYQVEFARSTNLDDLTKAEVGLRNTLGDATRMRYRALWKDAEGFSVGDAGPWRTVFLGSGEIKDVTLTAPSPDGQRVVVQIQDSE